MNHTCPLCSTANPAFYHRDAARDYYQCTLCALVFVPPSCFLSPEQELAEYSLHQNDPQDPQYRAFLNRLFEPMQTRLHPGSKGLDFGCGPAPTLSVMFQEAGHNMLVYDKFFASNPTVFKETYDFITASEVVEHLHQPGLVLQQLWDCLKPGGLLGIMTKRVRDAHAFKTWHYIRDLTHVCFFSKVTFEWVATHWQAKVEFSAKDIVLFSRGESSNQ